MELIGEFTEEELDGLSFLENESNLVTPVSVCYDKFTKVSRRSSREWDIEIEGITTSRQTKKQNITVRVMGDDPDFLAGKVKDGDSFTVEEGEISENQFTAWLPLYTIHKHAPWSSKELAKMCDYPRMAMDGDWSAIRDTSAEKIWKIFMKFCTEPV